MTSCDDTTTIAAEPTSYQQSGSREPSLIQDQQERLDIQTRRGTLDVANEMSHPDITTNKFPSSDWNMVSDAVYSSSTVASNMSSIFSLKSVHKTSQILFFSMRDLVYQN